VMGGGWRSRGRKQPELDHGTLMRDGWIPPTSRVVPVRAPSRWIGRSPHRYALSSSDVDSNRICTDTNSDVTIYHILFRVRIRIRIQNKYFEFGFTFEYLFDLQHRVINEYQFHLLMIL
jgi:hypothetical protein